MNKYSIPLLIALSIFYCCCSDQKHDELPGIGNALLNNEKWEGGVTSSYIDNEQVFFISIDKFSGNFLINQFFIRNVTKESGVFQTLLPDSMCDQGCTNFFVMENDILFARYDILENDNFKDWIIIDSIDYNKNEFWARFQASLIRTDDFNNQIQLPDTLYLTEGNINSRITEH